MTTEPASAGPQRWRLGWVSALLPLAWGLFGLLHAGQLYLGFEMEGFGDRVDYPGLIRFEVARWLLWWPVTEGIVRLSRLVPPAPLGPTGRRRRWWPVHLAAALVVAVAVESASTLLALWLVPSALADVGFAQRLAGRLTTSLHSDLILYAAILGVVWGWRSYRASRERAVRNARLETELARAQLATLRLQVQPHFLFNTLHSIAGQVRTGRSREAVTMLAGLSDLLRHSLATADRAEVTLEEELEGVSRYLEIQRVRFLDRLVTSIQVPDELLGARMPGFLLQPLVENAVRHGLDAEGGAGEVRIEATRRGSRLVIEVADTGRGPGAEGERRDGIGLGGARDRLRQLYGEGSGVELLARGGGGAVARVTLPFVAMEDGG